MDLGISCFLFQNYTYLLSCIKRFWSLNILILSVIRTRSLNILTQDSFYLLWLVILLSKNNFRLTFLMILEPYWKNKNNESKVTINEVMAFLLMFYVRCLQSFFCKRLSSQVRFISQVYCMTLLSDHRCYLVQLLREQYWSDHQLLFIMLDWKIVNVIWFLHLPLL